MNEPSTGRKLWEIVNPLVFIIAVMMCVTACISTGIMIYSRSIGENEVVTYSRILTSTIWCDLAMYIVIIVGRQKNILYDKFKYEHKSSGWPFWKLALVASCGFLFSILVSVLIDLTGITNIFTGYEEASNLTFTGQPAILLIITVGIIGPIAEEFIFRWMIFGRIRYYYGSKWAILFSGLMFGVYHGNMTQFIFCSVVGFAFAYLYDKSGNIWVPIASHMAVNLFGIISFL